MSSVIIDSEAERIYDLIKEYLKKKSYFIIEEIVDFISYRIKNNPNINRNTIVFVLKELIKKKKIIPGIKLLKENILENKKREEVFDFIKKTPGVNVNEIKKELNLGSNHSSWHLTCLDKFEFIRAVKYGNQKAFFDFELDSSKDEVFFYFRKDKIKQIILLLESADSPLRPTAIAERLNTNFNTAKKYLEILVKLNILSMVNGNEKKSYILNRENYERTVKELGALSLD